MRTKSLLMLPGFGCQHSWTAVVSVGGLLQPQPTVQLFRTFFWCLIIADATSWSLTPRLLYRAATAAKRSSGCSSLSIWNKNLASRATTTTTTTTVPRGGNSGSHSSSSHCGALRSTTAAASSSTSASKQEITTVAFDLEQEADCSINADDAVSGKEIMAAAVTDVEILTDDDEFMKPDRDNRQYRLVRLKANNLKVLLISDQMAVGDVGAEAASVHVQAGHFDDTIPGLAHFHEHMLFLGTEKYPKEDEYENFLSQNGGGSSNAYTDMEDTNYYFSIVTENKDPNQTSQGLAGALDRLAQFFICPKFDPDAVDRELKAIDSEYRNGKTSDSWRNYQALKSFANSSHPFAKFGCGNLETLSAPGTEKLLQELKYFWDTFYRSYNLRLAVVGHASLDALQQTVVETFGGLPYSEGAPRYASRTLSPKQVQEIMSSMTNGDVAATDKPIFVREAAAHGCRAFGQQQLGMVRYIKPLLEARSVKVHFAVPPLDDPLLTRSKPYRVLSHLLGHESPGSLHALLNEEGYLTSLSSGMAIDASDFCLFSLTVSLTPRGMANVDKVLDLIFQWIALLQQNQDQLEPHHEELRQISQVNFKFRENDDPADFCSGMAELLFDESMDPHKLLLGSSATEAHDPLVTAAFLDRLKPENALIVITNSDMGQQPDDDSWTVEPWYGAPHKDEPIDARQIQLWESPPTFDERLHIPKLNAYIPDDFSLRCDDENGQAEDKERGRSEISVPPVVLVDTPSLRLWHKMDKYWRVPKAFIRMSLLTPDVYRSPRSMTYNRMFQRILNDDLNSFVYDASLAGCTYKISCLPTGYRIGVRGYSQKLSFLLDTLTSRIFSLMKAMKEGEPSLQQKFDLARESLCRETKNYKLDPPHEVANYNSRLVIEEDVWYIDNYIDEMEGPSSKRSPLTMKECAEVAEECLSKRIKCEALCMGNLGSQEALSVAELIDKRFLASSKVLSDVETPHFRSLKCPTREEAGKIFGPEASKRSIPLIYADIAFSPSEENNAVEVILQAGSELELGYQGLATFDLLTHIAYNSAYNQLRTVEQLGYIASVFARKTAGNAWAMSIVVQSSSVSPEKLEERVEAWLKQFRDELAAMSPEEFAAEGDAVAAQLLENETKLSHEVGNVWGEILNTEGMTDGMRTPAFDRLKKLSHQLLVDQEFSDDDHDGEEANDNKKEGKSEREPTGLTGQILKERALAFYDSKFSADSPDRRALSARVYSQNWKEEYDTVKTQPGVVSSFADIRHLKQFLSSWPTAPYWRIDNSTVTIHQQS